MSVSIEAMIFTRLLFLELTAAHQDDMHIICKIRGKIAMRAACAHNNTWQKYCTNHSYYMFFCVHLMCSVVCRLKLCFVCVMCFFFNNKCSFFLLQTSVF